MNKLRDLCSIILASGILTGCQTATISTISRVKTETTENLVAPKKPSSTEFYNQDLCRTLFGYGEYKKNITQQPIRLDSEHTMLCPPQYFNFHTDKEEDRPRVIIEDIIYKGEELSARLVRWRDGRSQLWVGTKGSGFGSFYNNESAPYFVVDNDDTFENDPDGCYFYDRLWPPLRIDIDNSITKFLNDKDLSGITAETIQRFRIHQREFEEKYE